MFKFRTESRDLHGITDRGNRGIARYKPRSVMGKQVLILIYRGSGGNGDSCLYISIDKW